MSRLLLKEYVSQLVEKIRSEYIKGGTSVKDGGFGNKFNLETFKNMDDLRILNSYANRFLEKLGQGSSRAAYLLSSRHALKIAVNKRGLAQNKAELSVYTNPQTKPMIASIRDYEDTEYRWLIADVVRPIETEQEFEDITGIQWENFLDSLIDDDVTQTPLSRITRATMDSNDLVSADIQVLDHWGKTADGRIVLLDYGYTDEVYNKYYKGLNWGSVSKTNQPNKSQMATADSDAGESDDGRARRAGLSSSLPNKYMLNTVQRQAPTKK